MKPQKKHMAQQKAFKTHKDLPPMTVSHLTTAINKTGYWRALTPVIDYNKCISCGIEPANVKTLVCEKSTCNTVADRISAVEKIVMPGRK